MNRLPALWGATLGAISGYSLAALLPILPRLHFYPQPGSWSFSAFPGEPAIQWYGFMIYSALGGFVGLAAASVSPKRPPWLLVWWVWAILFAILVWHERGWFMR